MKIRAESYPDRIRQIAKELSQIRGSYDVDHSVETLRKIADELERKLEKGPSRRA
jgi:hypothetical protein